MRTPTADPLLRYTDSSLARPLPPRLHAARQDVLAAVRDLGTIPDAVLTRPWSWIGGGEEEIRYGFYRLGEAFELAGHDAAVAIRSSGEDRGRAADLIAPATAARWDLQGLLVPLPDATWSADPGEGEWNISRTIGHVIEAQRSYGLGTAWWQTQGYRADDPTVSATTPPDALWEETPSEEQEAEGSPTEIRNRLDGVLDLATERLSGLPADRLGVGARWSGFTVDVGFRLGRWASHIREHTIQVEKTLVMLDHRPTEVDRLVRLIIAAWGRAEAVVYGVADAGEAVEKLAAAAAGARVTAAEVADIARADAGR